MRTPPHPSAPSRSPLSPPAGAPLARRYLNGNSLSGSLPTQLSLLTALRFMYLYDNSLSGSLPTQLGARTALSRMYLKDNSLSGSLPTQLGALTALTCL